MWLLDRRRSDVVAGYSVMPTREVDLVVHKEPLDYRDGFREPFDPGGSSIKREPSLFVFGSDGPSTQAELKTSVSQEISGRGFARDQDRVDLRRFSGEGLAHSADHFSNCAGLVKSRAEWRRTGL